MADCSSGPRVVTRYITVWAKGDEAECRYCGKTAVYDGSQWAHADATSISKPVGPLTEPEIDQLEDICIGGAHTTWISKPVGPLTEPEVDLLKVLIDRAILNGQFSIGVASPFSNPAEDSFREGDRHDGNCASNTDWKTFVSVGTRDDGPETAELKLLVDQKSLNFITNGDMNWQ